MLVFDLIEPRYLSMLYQKAGDVSIVGKPLIEFIVESIDISRGIEAPHLALPGRVPKRFERYLNFYRPSPFFDHALRFHHDVDREIRSLAFSVNTILLDTERIKTDHVSSTLIVI